MSAIEISKTATAHQTIEAKNLTVGELLHFIAEASVPDRATIWADERRGNNGAPDVVHLRATWEL